MISEDLQAHVRDIIDISIPVVVFGSRARGDHHQYSDLDLCIKQGEPISTMQMALWKEGFENSNIPFLVDLVDYAQIDDSFRRIIDRDGISI